MKKLDFCLISVHNEGMTHDFVVIGAGIAGLTAIQELRRLAPASSLALIDRENRLPYKRTKLTKELAAGFAPEQFALLPLSWYQENRVDLRLGQNVLSLDPAAKQVTLADGTVLTYRKLLLAVGAEPILPQGYQHLPEVLVLRNQDQTELLRQRWSGETEINILGNGVLGVEIAEQAVLAGKTARLFSRHPLPCHRDLSVEASTMLQGLLEDHGIEQLKHCSSRNGLCVAAVGSSPSQDLAKAAGLNVGEGILVDEALNTSAADIWAAGDCAEMPGGRIGHLWHEAEHLAKMAVHSMLGLELPALRPFRLKLEVFGEYYFTMNKPDSSWWDRVEQRRNRRYQCFYFSYDQLHGVVMANDKDKNKLYEQAVLERWHRDRVLHELGL